MAILQPNTSETRMFLSLAFIIYRFNTSLDTIGHGFAGWLQPKLCSAGSPGSNSTAYKLARSVLSAPAVIQHRDESAASIDQLLTASSKLGEQRTKNETIFLATTTTSNIRILIGVTLPSEALLQGSLD